MKKNKTGQYFKYAIGEIILVVIGILIDNISKLKSWEINAHKVRLALYNQAKSLNDLIGQYIIEKK